MNTRSTFECPFNAGHQIPNNEEKIIQHYKKCPDKVQKEHLFSQCTHSKIHWVKKERLKDHHETCPDNKMLKKALEESRIDKAKETNNGDGATAQKKKRDRKGKNGRNPSEETKASEELAEMQPQAIIVGSREGNEPAQVNLNWEETYNAIKKLQILISHPVRNAISLSQNINTINNSFHERNSIECESGNTSRIHYNKTNEKPLRREHINPLTTRWPLAWPPRRSRVNNRCLIEERKEDFLTKLPEDLNLLEAERPKIYESSISKTNQPPISSLAEEAFAIFDQSQRIMLTESQNKIQLDQKLALEKSSKELSKPANKVHASLDDDVTRSQNSNFLKTKDDGYTSIVTQNKNEKKSEKDSKKHMKKKSPKTTPLAHAKHPGNQLHYYLDEDSKTKKETTIDTKKKALLNLYFGDEIQGGEFD